MDDVTVRLQPNRPAQPARHRPAPAAGAQRRRRARRSRRQSRGARANTTGPAQIRDAIPFGFEPKAPPPPPPPSRPPTPPHDREMPVVPTGPPPPPPIPLKFIGLVEKADGTKIAVLSDGRRPHSRRRRTGDRRTVSDSEDRQRVDRDGVSRRARAADDSLDGTMTRHMTMTSAKVIMVTIFAAKRVVALSVVVSLAMVAGRVRGEPRVYAAARRRRAPATGTRQSSTTARRVQDDPDRAEYKIALERATFAAAALHADRARKAEEEGRLDEALREYRRVVGARSRAIARSRPRPASSSGPFANGSRPRGRDRRSRRCAKKPARRPAEPLLTPTSPLGPVRFNNANARDVLNFIGESTGINVHLRSRFHGPPDHDQRRRRHARRACCSRSCSPTRCSTRC